MPIISMTQEQLDNAIAQGGALPAGVVNVSGGANVPSEEQPQNIKRLQNQILSQGTTGRWTGEGFGGPERNAFEIAKTLDAAGITDIKDFGVRDVADGYHWDYFDQMSPWIETTRQEYYNKKTGQPITTDYNRVGGNIFSGTYAGEGRTNFGVQFAPDGTPYFYTQFGGDTSSMADIAPVLSILSIIPSPLQPFAAAANALIAIDNGNTLGGLAALAGIPGVSQAASAAGLANVATGIQTANQVVNLVNAIDSGNVLGAVATGAGLAGAGSTPITDGGMTVNDALRAANLVNAIDSGDPGAIFNAASRLAQSKTFQNSLSQPGTTVSSTGEVAADVVGPNFAEQLTNPDSPNYIGQAEEQLGNIINGPSTQVASTDQDDVLQAIEDLRSQQAEVSPLDVLGQPLTEAAKDIIPTQEPPITSPLDVLGQPLTEEAKNIEPVYGLDPNLVAIGQGEQAAIDTAENVGNLEGLSSAEVGQGEQAAIDTESNIGSLEGLSSAEVGEGEQAAIDTIPQDQAIADLAATEGTVPVTEPTRTPGVSVGSGATTGTGATTPTKTTTNSISTAPVAGGLASVGIPWLDTSADVLQGQSVQGNTDPFAELDPGLAEVLRQRGFVQQADIQPLKTTLMASGGSAFGSELDDKLMPKFAPSDPEMLQTVASAKRTPLALKQLRHLQQNISPLGNMGSLAAGGLPKKYQEAAPKGHRPEFVTGLTGYYADGRGTGQSDDIPAMLHDGDYVMDAETVSALGDGSSKAGRQVLDGFRQQVPHSAKSGGSVVPAKIADGEYVFPESFVTALGQGDNKRGASILDGLREKLREHKRSAPLNKIPPKAKSPLDYIKKAKG